MLDDVAELLRARLPGRTVLVAHMEIAEPGLAEVIAGAYGDGARRVDVLPYFLAPGRHSTGDIPRMAREAEARHPELTVRVHAPLGVHPGLVDALLSRLDA